VLARFSFSSWIKGQNNYHYHNCKWIIFGFLFFLILIYRQRETLLLFTVLQNCSSIPSWKRVIGPNRFILINLFYYTYLTHNNTNIDSTYLFSNDNEFGHEKQVISIIWSNTKHDCQVMSLDICIVINLASLLCEEGVDISLPWTISPVKFGLCE
jgi:hypothetical protein